ncbi:uncharacterized protein A4U43_C10F6350 [Asparagus officinalis]|uniref:Uncharacterized protein n=1 Tax=Asparagus officinalis TaxID=4686 RepID=A0A5P1E1J8_ASPOF|nr:uncharacterized protein A4U43_C10F6350 [Asparagus officinalis]
MLYCTASVRVLCAAVGFSEKTQRAFIAPSMTFSALVIKSLSFFCLFSRNLFCRSEHEICRSRLRVPSPSRRSALLSLQAAFSTAERPPAPVLSCRRTTTLAGREADGRRAPPAGGSVVDGDVDALRLETPASSSSGTPTRRQPSKPLHPLSLSTPTQAQFKNLSAHKPLPKLSSAENA